MRDSHTIGQRHGGSGGNDLCKDVGDTAGLSAVVGLLLSDGVDFCAHPTGPNCFGAFEYV